MTAKAKLRKPVPQAFVQAIAAKAEQEESNLIPKNMDFPMWDEMEMDVPFIGLHVDSGREFSEDDSDVDMQCLIHVNPTLAVSSLAI